MGSKSGSNIEKCGDFKKMWKIEQNINFMVKVKGNKIRLFERIST